MTPQGWQEKTLDEVCSFSRGLTYSKNDEVEFSDNIVLRANNIDLVSNSLNFDELKYITSTFAIPEDKKVKENSIMICISSGSKSHLGKVAFIDRDYGYAFGGFMGLMTPKENINPKYLYYMLITPSFKDLILHLTDGANINNLKYNDLKNFKLNIPPLPEQQRIVAKLDEAFEAIDKVKANAEQNLNNAKEIYNIKKELIFKTVLENKPVEFGDIIELLTDYHANGSYKLLKEHVELLDNENYAWMIRSTDFENEFKNNFKYINEKAYNFLEKTKIFGNEIIMSKIGNAGKIYLMPVVNRPVSLAMNLFLIRVKKKLAISSYVYRFLLTNIGQKQINERCKGAATQTITKDNVRSIKIYLPNTLSEQQKIVEKLDALQEQTKHLEQIYTKKIKECDELKQSILQKAFRGEL